MNSLEFWNYSIKDLRKEEELCTYPPQFDVTIKDLEKHSKNLDIQFKITLETDGVLVSDDFQELPIPIIINEDRRMRLGSYCNNYRGDIILIRMHIAYRNTHERDAILMYVIIGCITIIGCIDLTLSWLYFAVHFGQGAKKVLQINYWILAKTYALNCFI